MDEWREEGSRQAGIVTRSREREKVRKRQPTRGLRGWLAMCGRYACITHPPFSSSLLVLLKALFLLPFMETACSGVILTYFCTQARTSACHLCR